MDNFARSTIPLILISVLVACGGGGGGGGGGGAGSVAGTNDLPGVLEFESPDSFANGRSWSTSGGLVRLVGGVRPAYSPDECDHDSGNTQPREFMRLTWRNEATGQQGETAIFVVCRESGTIFGSITRTFWSTGFLDLQLGPNRIRFSTYEAGRQIGEDVVTIKRTDGVPAEIIYRYPIDGALEVPVNRRVQVRFSEPMDENRLTAERFVLTNTDAGEVPGTRHYDPVHWVWEFAPSAALAPDAEYHVVVSRSVMDLGGGGGLSQDAVWSFRTGSARDVAPPIVIGQWPGESCNCAPLSTNVLATFDEPLLSRSVDAASLTLVDESGATVTGQVSYIGAKIEFTPDAPLVPGVRYRATVTASVQDTAGNFMAAPSVWTFSVRDSASLGRWQVGAETPEPIRAAVGVSDGIDFYVWGEVDELDADQCDPADLQCVIVRSVGKGARYDVAGDRWQPLAHEIADYDFDLGADVMVPFPALRGQPSVVWTGSEIILYSGGQNGRPVLGGGRYDPIADAWSQMSVGWWRDNRLTFIQALARHSAVWTGTHMIVWGGLYGWDEMINRGWAYRPIGDAWSITGPEPSTTEDFRLIPDDTAPAARVNHTAVWTGGEMIVWGGQDANGRALGDGGRYDIGSNTWTPLPIENAPLGGTGTLSAVWTGSQMIVWNGGQTAVPGPSLKRYEPATDRWLSSTSGWEPRFDGQRSYVAFWTGTAMLVAGIEHPEDVELTRVVATYLYDPQADQWLVGTRQTISDHGSFAADWIDGTLVVFDGRQAFTFAID